MGVFGAMITSVSGLRAQSYALENISGNIANSQTTGFKRVDTAFTDLVPETPYKRELPGSVLSFSRSTNTLQGDIQNSGVATHTAINGEGFFTVAKRTDFVGGQAVFDGRNLYTRRGDFDLDKDGYLVNGAGYYLKGVSIDPVTGLQQGSGTGVLQVSRDQIPPAATTRIDYRVNLPATPATTNYTNNNRAAGSELLQVAGYTTNPLTTGTVLNQPPDVNNFVAESVSGANISVYAADGTPTTFELRWAKVTNAPTATWAAFIRVDDNPAAAAVTWQRIGPNPTSATGDFTFDAAGNLTSASSFTIPAMTIKGVPIGAMNFDASSGGIKQYYDGQQVVQASSISQDGYSTGLLNNVRIDGDGRVVGNYSNGKVLPLAQLSTAQFNADNALKRLDGGVFEETLESGPPLVGQNGASFVAGSLENSNVDIADEFSKMIITQQAYSANTRVITTAQQMLQDTINIVR